MRPAQTGLSFHDRFRAGARFRDGDAFGDVRLQVLHMTDDAHKLVVTRQIRQQADGVAKSTLVKRPEAFVYEHGVEFHAASVRLHDVGQPQRQAQRCLERLAAGKR